MEKKTAQKVNIDDLIDVLMDLRKDTEHVDITIEDGNVVRVRPYKIPTPEEGPMDADDIKDNLNELLG